MLACCRALAEDLPAEESPAGWWDVEADVGLLVGLYRHGLHAYEEVRRDPELVAAFQVGLWGGRGGHICRMGQTFCYWPQPPLCCPQFLRKGLCTHIPSILLALGSPSLFLPALIGWQRD